MRAIRGAITVQDNNREEIISAAGELMNEIINRNSIKEEELVSIIFTATSDLDRAYPAVAVREMGYKLVPLLCYQEMKVVGSLKKCIRTMVLINRDCSLEDIKHIYLREASRLRPDLVQNEK